MLFTWSETFGPKLARLLKRTAFLVVCFVMILIKIIYMVATIVPWARIGTIAWSGIDKTAKLLVM